MAMDKKAVQEWVAEYQLINAAEREMLRQELPLIPPGEGTQRYFRLCQFLTKLSPDAWEAFADERRKHYLALEARLRKATEYFCYDFPS
ncbi:MAG: hypothetical protein ACOYYU_21480 [Chloroflexota bacterium]